jgi:DnaK suppressor protein
MSNNEPYIYSMEPHEIKEKILQGVTEASLRQAEEKLTNLQRVLSQIGTPEFGQCLQCHRPIPLGRILIRPESLYCVNCAR